MECQKLECPLNRWKQIDLHGGVGLFTMAFCYLKEGNVLITGTMQAVRPYFSDHPPFHAHVIHYNKKRIVQKKYETLGINNGIHLLHIPKFDFRHRASFGTYIRKHTRFIMTYKDVVVGQWRRLPERYISQFDDITKWQRMESESKSQWI